MAKETKTTNGLSIDYIIHPGSTLAEVLEDRHMSQKELSVRTDVTAKHISTIIAGEKGISVSFAKKLEYALGIEAQFWINLQSTYDREMLEYEDAHSITDEETSILKQLKEVIDDFRERGWISANSKDALVLEMRSLLQVSNLCNIPKIPCAAAYRVDSTAAVNPYVLFAWQKMCEKQAMESLYTLTECELNLLKLQESINEIKSSMFLTADNMRKKLKMIFSQCGIVFDVVQNYKGAPVQGYIKEVDNKMLLCITLRRKYMDVFWFTLFHEIGHILNGDTKNVFIDFENEYNQSEVAADTFARDALINPETYRNFIDTNRADLRSIKKLAQDNNVDASIVIGRLMKDGLLEWNEYSEYRKKYVWKKS
ncbi:MAG: HigA family addiction module antitoxin [Bacillota bacterium]|nr:HigA family addiction module antitoxin [Bacillota bacterium]